MRFVHLSVVVALVFCSAARAQERPDQEQQPEQQNPPTLEKEAPKTAPSLEGPHTSTLSDARKLMHIRTVYVDRIDNQLSDKLAERIAKMGRFRIVAERKEADAVLTGTCFDSRRLKRVHSEVFLNERASGASIWQDVVRRPYNPPSLAKSVDDTAELIVTHLNETLQEVDRK